MILNKWPIGTLVSFLFITSLGKLPSGVESTDTACQPIQVTECLGFGYASTRMSNLAGDDTQNEAQRSLATYTPLVQFGCSSQLKFFLCSVYVPMCTDKVHVHIGPCRPLCQAVKMRCEPILKNFGYSWPNVLNCSKFPEVNNDEHMCMEGPEEAVNDQSQDNYQHTEEESTTTDQSSSACSNTKNGGSYVFRNISGGDQCLKKCESHYTFSPEDKHMAQIWFTIWTTICFTSTLFTILTFLISSKRLLYPERCILYVSVCYNFYSVGYIIRIFSGPRISCQLDSVLQEWIMVDQDLGGSLCGAVFALFYYCGTAANVWWLLLSCMWILCQRHGWDHQRLKAKSKYFHATAWSFPTAWTLAIMLLRVIDAEELTSTCFVGSQNKDNLLWFVIVPLFICLIFGIGINILGFSGWVWPKVPAAKTRDESQTCESRIGVYCMLYMVPVICLLGSYWYEYTNREDWSRLGTLPNVNVFMMRIFMSMAVGCTSIFWVCSKRTLESWRKLCCWICVFRNDKNLALHHSPVNGDQRDTVV